MTVFVGLIALVVVLLVLLLLEFVEIEIKLLTFFRKVSLLR
jgi:hypothetical protein